MYLYVKLNQDGVSFIRIRAEIFASNEHKMMLARGGIQLVPMLNNTIICCEYYS